MSNINRFSRLQTFRSRFYIACTIALAVILLAVGVSSQRCGSLASAADKPATGTSLDFAPADVSFYSGAYRIGEQLDLVTKSNAWNKLMNMATLQLGWGLAKGELFKPDSPALKVKEFFELPENQPLLDLLKDFASQEVFMMGDKQFAPTMQLFSTARRQGQISQGILFIESFGQIGPEELQAGSMAAMLDTARNDLDNLQIPNVLLGFKLSKPALAEQQMQRLETLLTRVLADIPQLQSGFKRIKIGDAPFLSLTVDGNMVPWDKIPWADYEEKPGDLDKLREKFRKLEVNVILGIKNGYLMLNIGPSNQFVTNLGTGPLLVNRTEFEAMKPFLQKKLASVAWATKETRQLETLRKEDLDDEDVADTVASLLERAPIDNAVKDRLKKDAVKMANDIKKLIPEFGPLLAFETMTDKGFDGYQYDWSENKHMDSSKPLDLINILGVEKPLLFSISRNKMSTDNYDTLVKWIKIGYNYFEEYGLPTIPDQQRGQVTEVLDGVIPLAQRVDKANRELLFPAFKDGQGGIVLDAKITSKTWGGGMPEAQEPLPMFELALFNATNDSAKIKSAFQEYRNVANDFLDVLRKANPDLISPDYKINEPKSNKVNSSEVFFYSMPEDLELDEQILPHVGLSERVALFSTSPRLTDRLTKAKPSELGEFLAATSGKPLTNVTYVDFSTVTSFITPWSNYWIQMDAEHHTDEPTYGATMSAVKKDLKTLAEILSCFKSHSSYTTIEEAAGSKPKVTVTRSQTLIQDMK